MYIYNFAEAYSLYPSVDLGHKLFFIAACSALWLICFLLCPIIYYMATCNTRKLLMDYNNNSALLTLASKRYYNIMHSMTTNYFNYCYVNLHKYIHNSTQSVATVYNSPFLFITPLSVTPNKFIPHLPKDIYKGCFYFHHGYC